MRRDETESPCDLVRGEGLGNLRALYHESLAALPGEELHPLFSELAGQERRYVVEDELGCGAMKRVVRAHDVRADRKVALAVLRPDFGPDTYDSFLREARLTARLRHPNIIRVHDVGTRGGRPYFTMELKPGRSLSDILRALQSGDETARRDFPMESRLELFLKVCDAVAYAHSRGVLHLDLKPDNIQVGEYGEVLVCDWGLGKVVADEGCNGGILALEPDLYNQMTLLGELKGTPGFMAPEQTERDAEKTTATDIYALGAVLYAILTLRAPVEGDTTAGILAQTREGVIIPPSRRCAGVPERLDAVVLKALARDPADRYGSVSMLREEVHLFLGGFATAAEHAGLLRSLSLLVKRHLSLVLTASAAMLLLVSLAGGFIIQLKRSGDEAVRARIRAEQQRGIAEALRTRAEDQQRLAEDHRRRAEDSLMLYQAQRRMWRQFGEDSQPNRQLREALAYLEDHLSSPRAQPDDYLAMQQHLSDVLASDPVNQQAQATQGYLRFIMQDFPGARVAMEGDWSPPPPCMELCVEFAGRPSAAGMPETATRTGFALDAGKVAELCRELVGRAGDTSLPVKLRMRAPTEEFLLLQHLAECLMVYDGAVRGNAGNHARVVHAVLQNWNPDWDGHGFRFEEESGSLRLGGSGLERIAVVDGTSAPPRCLLRSLPLAHLILDDAQLADLSTLRSLPLRTIDLRGCQFVDLEHVAGCATLEAITVYPGQFTADNLQRLPPHVRVREQPAP